MRVLSKVHCASMPAITEEVDEDDEEESAIVNCARRPVIVEETDGDEDEEKSVYLPFLILPKDSSSSFRFSRLGSEIDNENDGDNEGNELINIFLC